MILILATENAHYLNVIAIYMKRETRVSLYVYDSSWLNKISIPFRMSISFSEIQL